MNNVRLVMLPLRLAAALGDPLGVAFAVDVAVAPVGLLLVLPFPEPEDVAVALALAVAGEVLPVAAAALPHCDASYPSAYCHTLSKC